MKPTCKHCLGMSEIIVNAGTGLRKSCPKCRKTEKTNGHEVKKE
jgi:hypothetical protein